MSDCFTLIENIKRSRDALFSLNLIVNLARSHRLQTLVGNVVDKVVFDSSTDKELLCLLNTCIEDIYKLLLKFRTKNRVLVVSVVKYGLHDDHFHKLYQQLRYCSLGLSVEVDVSEDGQDFQADANHLLGMLPYLITSVNMTGSDDSTAEISGSVLDSLVEKTTILINTQIHQQVSQKPSISSQESTFFNPDDISFTKPCGRPGSTTVWLGKYQDVEKIVIKVHDPNTEKCTVEEFRQEIEMTRKISHLNITSCFGVFETDRALCMVLEFVENGNLFTEIKSNINKPPLPFQKIDLALGIATGIDFLHRQGIIHRDLKLANVLLDANMIPKICDFGSSLKLDMRVSAASRFVTVKDAGTTHYMAPETFGQNAVFSTDSDVFAFGIILWAISDWSLPYLGMAREEIKDRVVNEGFRLAIGVDVPQAVASLVQSCWDQRPSSRPNMKTVEEFLINMVTLEDLENLSGNIKGPAFSVQRKWLSKNDLGSQSKNENSPFSLATSAAKNNRNIEAESIKRSKLNLSALESIPVERKVSKRKAFNFNFTKTKCMVLTAVLLVVLGASLGIYFALATGSINRDAVGAASTSSYFDEKTQVSSQATSFGPGNLPDTIFTLPQNSLSVKLSTSNTQRETTLHSKSCY
jgi:serine/threonine protein kinase